MIKAVRVSYLLPSTSHATYLPAR